MQTEIKEIHTMEERYLLLSDVPEEETFEEEMLLHNMIPGLLPMETGRLSGVKYHRYRIGGMKNLLRYLEGKKISGEQFELFFSRIFGEIRVAREYMLREDGFLIQPDTIYIDEATEEIGLCYYPEFHCPLVNQMRELSGWFLQHINPADERSVFNGYAFHVLCHGENCTFRSIARILEEHPALPEVSTWEEEEQGPEYREKKPRRKGLFFGGSMLFLAWVGAMLFFVMKYY